ncbi:MAG: histone H1 [Candidatus Kapabacteria bacterium]|nr:histone H1 [Candidatus Kapabacteria bacterium]MDW7997751.1 histone H1 [Bacteroidota bacterium]MDW8225599.1 histone H1 [Bacteroidota bacterium]
MEYYTRLLQLVQDCRPDFERFYLKQNRRAGIRLRKRMQELRRLAKVIRDEIQQLRRTFPPRPKRRPKQPEQE